MAGPALYIFWTGTALVLYTYLGYGLVVYILAKLRGRRPPPAVGSFEPDVTMVIAAYNEEHFIAEKIRNTLALSYPSGKFKVVVVTDGSSDTTPQIVRQFPSVTLYHQDERKGKIHAVNRVMKFIDSPIVVFSDANTFLNPDALQLMIRHFSDEKVGGVAGEKRIMVNKAESAAGSGEGLYWKYESFLKRKDSELYSVVGAAGELFAVRRSVYEDPAENMLIEDFYLSLRIAMKGYRFVYEPGACAMESATLSVAEEWKRKIRISAGGFQAMAKLGSLLNPIRYGILSFQYISHRVLRWTLAPLALPLIFISNVVLLSTGATLFKIAFACQVGFYLLAWAGWSLQDRKVSIKGFFVPYYFSVMNLSVYVGLVRYLRGRQSILWEKAARAATSS